MEQENTVPGHESTIAERLHKINKGNDMDLESLMKTLVKRALANQSSANKQSR